MLQNTVVRARINEEIKDHALTGNWADYRDCHIRPDLLLIYFPPLDINLNIKKSQANVIVGIDFIKKPIPIVAIAIVFIIYTF